MDRRLCDCPGGDKIISKKKTVRRLSALYTGSMAPRRDPLRDQLHELAELRQQPLPRPDDPGYAPRQALLRTALTGKSNFAVAAAADLLHESDRALLALLAEAFTRFD